MMKEIDLYSTFGNGKVWEQIQSNYQTLQDLCKQNPEVEIFKQQYELIYKGMQESVSQESILIKRYPPVLAASHPSFL